MGHTPALTALVLVDINWGIGRGNALLASPPEDMARFRRMTRGGTVIVGRKTLESFPNSAPLEGRRHLVLSRTHPWEKGVEVVGGLDALFETLTHCSDERVWVIGGGEVYRQILPYCQEVWVTRLEECLEADTFFPNLDQNPSWERVRRERGGVYRDRPFFYDVYRQSNPKTHLE